MHSSRMRTGRSLTVCCSVLPRGVSARSQGGFSLVPGGGCLVPGGVLLGPGGVLPGLGGSLETPTPPPINRITDTCKNITLATTSLRSVKRLLYKCITKYGKYDCLQERSILRYLTQVMEVVWYNAIPFIFYVNTECHVVHNNYFIGFINTS